MKALVVYESWFGNTRLLAEAIAAALPGEAAAVSVDDPPPPLGDLDLLVVGAPTHVHGLSSAMSRRSAIEQGSEAEGPGIGVRGWLRQLPEGRHPRAAAFDTRIEKPVILVGSAARGIAKRFRRHGLELAVEPESFSVLDTEGPLKEGELERAAEWARALAARSAPAAAPALTR